MDKKVKATTRVGAEGSAPKVADLEKMVRQIDRQSRCRHVWEPDREDPRKRVCAECGCSPLGRQ